MASLILHSELSEVHLFFTQSFLLRGIVDWSPEIGSILADGELLLQQAASTSGPGLVSILIEVQLHRQLVLSSTFHLLYSGWSFHLNISRELQTLGSLHWLPHWQAKVDSLLSR